MVCQLRKRESTRVAAPAPLDPSDTIDHITEDSIDTTALGGDDEGNSLFANVKKGRAKAQSAVDEWIQSYRQDKASAILELLQFFTLAAGCKGKITAEMKETMDNAKIIRELIEDFDDQAGGDYPIITNGPQWKKFRVSFCEFVNTLIRQCQYSIIYDQYLMETMISFLITLSDSQVRAFRHTATLAAMKLMTALVDVALTLSISIDNTQRQLDKARKEKSRGDKLDNLILKRQELDENMEDLKTMLGYLFKSIFVHRYRDIVPEIRALCVFELGIWMKKFPNYFLDDSYLKYVGWTFYDKVGDVRLKCLQSFLPLYETEEIACKMELFANKFKERIVEMTMDKEPEVAVQAIKLLISIHKYHGEVLTDKDCEHVYELVYATHRGVAQAAGEFLNEKLFQVDEEATANLCSKRGKKRSVHTPLIRDLIIFFTESDHEHGAYLVDSLIDSHPMMKDWECMTDLLLEEPGPEEESLDDRHETSLIEIMVCAIKQAATGEHPIGRGPSRKQVSAKEAKQLAEARINISQHFIVTLPNLLDKYKTDSEKIANLMTIPQYFDLSHYTQNTDHLESLLSLINGCVEIHTDSDVLEACAKVYEYLYDENFTFKREVWVSKSELLDTLVLRKYKESIDAYVKSPDGLDERAEVVVNLKKISALTSCHDLNSYEIWEKVFSQWIRGVGSSNDSNVPEEAVKYSMNICYYSLIWELHAVSVSVNPTLIDSCARDHLQEFVSELKNILRHPYEEISREAYFTLCDIFVIFGPQLANDSAPLPNLVFRPTKSLVDQLIDYLESKVFAEEDYEESDDVLANSAVGKLYVKRQILAGFCKLIIYNIVPMQYAICIIRHFFTFYNDFGDITKVTLSKMREKDKVMCAKTMASALIQVFTELQSVAQQNHEALTKEHENFLALKELAKRFALSFGLDNQKNRDAIATLHREGIHFSFEKVKVPSDSDETPPNLPFLDILIEFSHKLIKQDKKIVLSYLDKCIQNSGVNTEEFQTLTNYRNTLTLSTEFSISLNRTPVPQNKGIKRNRGQNHDNDEDYQVKSRPRRGGQKRVLYMDDDDDNSEDTI